MTSGSKVLTKAQRKRNTPDMFWSKHSTFTRQYCRSGVFIVNLKQISQIVLVIPLLISNKHLESRVKSLMKTVKSLMKVFQKDK